MKNGVFTLCPKTPNCISSMEADSDRFVASLVYQGSIEAARRKLIEVINGFKRTQIEENSEQYIRASFTSFLFRFVDDVEFIFDEKEKRIHMKSASRSGSYDFGVNRRRCEAIRERFQ